MTTIDDSRLRLAADYIREHGWTQGAFENKGAVCLHGAIRACAPIDGDTEIIRAVLRNKGYTEDWNDFDSREEADVLEALASTHVTDQDLADTFGPQWESIVTLVRRAAALTGEEVEQLAAARAAASAAASAAARAAAWAAAWDAAWDAAWAAARVAAWDAARALVIRDLIGQHGFEQHHYDTLTGPWASVIGPVHPEDKPVTT